MRRITLAFLLLSAEAWSQTQADWWYFGHNAGMHFTASGPVAVSNGALYTSEGCATLSDASGNLLFYSDGIYAYDSTHSQMPNGFGLLGDPSSTHSAIVIPRPASNTDFYLFTVDDGGSATGLNYSRVDMTLNGGLGDIDSNEKNLPLAASTSEKVTAMKTSGGYWVVTHISNTDEFQAFKVTAAGVNSTPVISNTGQATAGFGFGIKSSTQGDKIAAVYFGSDSIFLYDFDQQTGLVTFAYKIGSTLSAGLQYGLEFSPSGQYLYMQSYSTADARQYDLSSGNSATVSASEVLIGSSGNGGGQLQLGPDKKMYCARNGQEIVSRINFPDSQGIACEWVDTAVVLASGQSCRWGLPTFVQSLFSTDANASSFCFGDSTQFTTDTAGIDSVIWNFGDPSSGAANQSTQLLPAHLFTDTGSFSVSLVAFADTLIDTVEIDVFIYPRQTVDLGSDTTLCTGNTFWLSAVQPFAEFLWMNGSTNDSLEVVAADTHWLTVMGICDTVSDTIVISFDSPILFDFPADTTLCEGQEIILDADLHVRVDTSFWNLAIAGDSITVSVEGFYRFEARNACGTAADSINVLVVPVPSPVLLPPDTLNCFDNVIVLTRPSLSNTEFVWSDSTTGLSYTVDTSETVWLAMSNLCGFSVDTFNAIFNGEILAELGEDTMICPEDSIVLNAHWPSATYAWNTGDTADTVWTRDETFLYVVTITAGLCQTIESRRVELNDLACPALNCSLQHANVMTPNADGLNDIFRPWSNCDIRDFKLRIFNRWGIQVYESDQRMLGWDGHTNGVAAPDGPYFFEVDFNDRVVVDEDRNIYRGSFTLIR